MIHPYFSVIADILPSVKFMPDEAKANVDKFKEIKDDYEEHMKKGNLMF